MSWEEQKWSANGDGPCPNEVIGAPSSGKKGAIIKGGRHSAGREKRTHNIRKPIQQPFETPNTILNLKQQIHSGVHTLLDFLSPKSVSRGSLPYLS